MLPVPHKEPKELEDRPVLLGLKVSKVLKVEDHKGRQVLKVTKGQDLRVLKVLLILDQLGLLVLKVLLEEQGLRELKVLLELKVPLVPRQHRVSKY